MSVITKLFWVHARHSIQSPLLEKNECWGGFDEKPDYLNMDSDPVCSPDFPIKDNDLYEIPRGYSVEVFAQDVLEHIPRAQMVAACSIGRLY